MAFTILLSLLHVQLAVGVASSQTDVSAYTANALSCERKLFIDRDVLEVHTHIRGMIDCLSRCTRDVQCELAVYQEFEDGSDSCTKLSGARDNPSATLDVAASRRCVAMFINTCLNGGLPYEGGCLCQGGFAGERCERINPSVCNVEWAEIVAPSGSPHESSVFDPIIAQEFGRTNPKLLFRDKTLNVVSVMQGMKADRDDSNKEEVYWYFVTFPFFERVVFNKFVSNPYRQFMNVLFSGKYQRLIIEGTNYTFADDTMELSFLSPRQTRFEITRKMSDEWLMVMDDLSKGYEMFSTTYVKQHLEQKTLVAHLVDRQLSTIRGGCFTRSPQMQDFIYILGQKTYTCETFMGDGAFCDIRSTEIRTIAYMNPCWARMRDDKYDGRASLIGWKMLGTYLRLGHDVRVKVGPTYHTVLEVIQIGNSFTFALAPYLSQTGTTKLIQPLYGVRSLISSSATIQSCTHQIEGEQVVDHSTTKADYVIWFVDTRTWNKVFTVLSNSTVVDGSMADLASGVKQGYDVRVWIKSLVSDLSLFLDTHMSSVTDDGKVSTESLVTWKTTHNDTAVELSRSCDMEYTLVTSDGHVETISFNVLTPATSTVHTSMLITWFLA